MDYITIIQGDDTNFLGDQFLVINFNTDIDLSGFTATFSLGDVTLTYGDLSGKNFEVILSDEITSNLKLGKQYGELKLIDTEKRIRTVTSVIPFLVRKGVNEEIKFVNNSLNVSMNINDTVLDVVIETPGIARAEATRMMSYCNEAKLSAQNSANSAQNTLIQLNQDVDVFYENISNLNEIVENAYQTCEKNITFLNETRDIAINEVQTLGDKEIELATQQADIATEKTREVSDTHIQALSDINTARQDSLNEIEEKNTSVLENFENVKEITLSEFEEKRVNSISDISETTIAGKELLTDIANQNLYKWNLFDIVQKDHILTYEEKQGLELLGTYVYKEGIVGERYGYPTFYETCLTEKEDSEEIVITVGEQSFTGYKNSNSHIYYDISEKEIVDNIYANTGIAWFYGIDAENERIFLPRNNYFFQNGNQENVGSYSEAGLPDHNHNVVALYWNYPGIAEEGRGNPDYGNHLSLTTTNASESNPIYGNSDTVQPPATKLATYMVVGNTAQKNAITNVIDTTTTENDTIPLLHCIYAENDMGINFLSSLSQWNNGKLYPSVYSKLVNLIGIADNVKEVDNDTITNTDFVVNQEDITFKLPIQTKQRVLIDKKLPTQEDNTWYNLYSDGWFENGGMYVPTANPSYINFAKPFVDTNYSVTALHVQDTSPTDFALTTASWNTKTTGSLQVYEGYNGGTQKMPLHWQVEGYVNITANDYKLCKLYFKVNNFVQNTQLLNAEEFSNSLVSKADADLSNCSKPYIVEQFKSGYSWYRKWSDGFIEQGGAICSANVSGWATITITLLLNFNTTDYLLFTQGNWSDPASSSCYITAKTVSNFTTKYAVNNLTNPGAWYACGY